MRQTFVKNLEHGRGVIAAKLDGFPAMTHRWSSGAPHGKAQTIVYTSSRQAHDPGPRVPGYCAAIRALRSLPKVLRVNLDKDANEVTRSRSALRSYAPR